MCFDDPIYLDRGSFEDLMVDTDQHRICWMYHDILSHPRIAWLFDKYAGKGTPIREAWTTMAWVAAGYQEDSFYLLFKWYEDFYDPPQRSDLYFVEREGPDGEIRVRFLNRDFQNKLERRELAWCENFPVRVSQNASYFFGDSKFDANPVGRILQLLGRNAGRELECFDWYFGRRSDGEKSRLCATIAAYFCSVQAIREILFSLVASDGKTPEGSRHMRADDLLEILKPVSAQIDEERLPALGRLFQDLADGFFDEPSRAPYLSRGGGPGLDRPHGDRGTSLAAAGQTERPPAPPGAVQPLCPPECVGCVPPVAGGGLLHRSPPPAVPGFAPGGLPSLPV